MKIGKRIVTAMLFLVVMAVLMPLTAVKAEAATTIKMKKLELGRTYTYYDVTGDGAKDKIVVKEVPDTSNPYAPKLGYVYINGKRAFKTNVYYPGDVYLMYHGSVGTLILQGYYGDGGSEVYNLTYQSGKFKKVRLATTVDGFAFYRYPVLANGKLEVHCGPKGSWWQASLRDNFTEMPFEAVIKYTMSGCTLKRVSAIASIDGRTSYHADTSFKTGLTSTTALSGKGPYVSKGRSVTLKGIRCYNYTTYYKISVGGKIGWFKDSDLKKLKV